MREQLEHLKNSEHIMGVMKLYVYCEICTVK